MTRRGDDGFILIAVLWMLAMLAALASAYAVYAVETAPSAGLIEQRLRAEAAIRAGVELCAFQELSWPKTARPDGGAFSTRVGDSVIDVVYRAETARVDLNAAPRDMIAGSVRRARRLGVGRRLRRRPRHRLARASSTRASGRPRRRSTRRRV